VEHKWCGWTNSLLIDGLYGLVNLVWVIDSLLHPMQCATNNCFQLLQMSFSVVLADNWCAAVPASWVDEERGIYKWPKNDKQSYHGPPTGT
jgi:hypothetical protein